MALKRPHDGVTLDDIEITADDMAMPAGIAALFEKFKVELFKEFKVEFATKTELKEQYVTKDAMREQAAGLRVEFDATIAAKIDAMREFDAKIVNAKVGEAIANTQMTPETQAIMPGDGAGGKTRRCAAQIEKVKCLLRMHMPGELTSDVAQAQLESGLKGAGLSMDAMNATVTEVYRRPGGRGREAKTAVVIKFPDVDSRRRARDQIAPQQEGGLTRRCVVQGAECWLVKPAFQIERDSLIFTAMEEASAVLACSDMRINMKTRTIWKEDVKIAQQNIDDWKVTFTPAFCALIG